MSAPPVPPAGAPSSAPSPGSAAAGTPLRIDTEKSWARANAWLNTPEAAAAGAKGTEVKQALDLAKVRWGQPGQAAPLVLQACQLAGLEPVAGDELVAVAPATPAQPATTTPAATPAQPAPNPLTWTPLANPPARKLALATTTAPPAQPAPFWRRLAVAAAIIAAATGVGLAGAVVGVAAVGLAAAGGLGGLAIVGAVIAVRRGGAVGLAGAAALVVAAIALAVGLAGGHIHATGGGVAAVLAGAVIAAVTAVGDDFIAAARAAMDKSGAQRPQR